MDHDAAIKIAAAALEKFSEHGPPIQVTGDEGKINITLTPRSNENIARVAVEAYLVARGIKHD